MSACGHGGRTKSGFHLNTGEIGRLRRRGFGTAVTRRLKYLAVCGLILLCASVCGARMETGLSLGLLCPLNGPLSELGKDLEQGAVLAVMEVNAAGGVHGKEVKLAVGDTGSGPLAAQQEAGRLLAFEDVDCLMGVLDPDVADSVSKLSDIHKVIFLGAGHINDRLLMDQYHPYYFHVTPAGYQMVAAAGFYAANQEWRRLVVCGVENSANQNYFEEFRQVLSAENKAVTLDGPYWTEVDNLYFKPLIESIRASEAQALLCLYRGADLLEFIRQGLILGLFDRVKLICPFDGDYSLLCKLDRRLPEGQVMGAYHHLNMPHSAENRNFIYRFKGLTDRLPSQAALAGYVAVKFAAAGFASVPRDVEGERVIEAMEGLELGCPWDPEGHTSFMHPKAHQMSVCLALGVTVASDAFPPAKWGLKEFYRVMAEKLLPSSLELFEGRIPSWR